MNLSFPGGSLSNTLMWSSHVLVKQLSQTRSRWNSLIFISRWLLTTFHLVLLCLFLSVSSFLFVSTWIWKPKINRKSNLPFTDPQCSEWAYQLLTLTKANSHCVEIVFCFSEVGEKRIRQVLFWVSSYEAESCLCCHNRIFTITFTVDVLFSHKARWGMHFLQCNHRDTLLQWDMPPQIKSSADNTSVL